jgi:hypothetical protein
MSTAAVVKVLITLPTPPMPLFATLNILCIFVIENWLLLSFLNKLQGSCGLILKLKIGEEKP